MVIRAVWESGVVKDLGSAFICVALLSLVVLVGVLVKINERRLPIVGVVLMLVCPVLCQYVTNIYLPDLFYAALLSLLFYALLREQMMFVMLWLFLLQLTRESTLLVSSVLFVLALCRRRWGLATVSVAATLAGMAIVALYAQMAKSNIHGMGGLTYLCTKLIANGAANCLGIIVWSDSYARQFPDRYSHAPLWRMALPAYLSLGSIREMGVYQYLPGQLADTMKCLLTTFGTLPLVLFSCLKRKGIRVLWQSAFPVLLALLIGVLFYCLGPFSGRSVDRLVGYGWPLFWLAIPLLDAKTLPKPIGSGLWLYLSSFFCMWWPVLIRESGVGQHGYILFSGILCCYALTWLCLEHKAFAYVRPVK